MPYYADQFTDIAPALPPDRWPTDIPEYDDMDEVAFAAFEYGFKQCYKLFTGKDLLQ